jgi:hypothetical protein
MPCCESGINEDETASKKNEFRNFFRYGIEDLRLGPDAVMTRGNEHLLTVRTVRTYFAKVREFFSQRFAKYERVAITSLAFNTALLISCQI